MRPGSQLPRPNSELDFNEIEEQEMLIDQLDDEALNDKFEEMLVRSNPPSTPRDFLATRVMNSIGELATGYTTAAVRRPGSRYLLIALHRPSHSL